MSDTTTTELERLRADLEVLSGTPSGNRHFITSAIESRGKSPGLRPNRLIRGGSFAKS